MEGFLTRFIAGEMFNDPLIIKLLFIIIFFLGASQAVRIIHGFWKTGRLKVQEKQVEEEKGHWKSIISELVSELKQRNERAEKIYDKVQWLYEVHHKFDDDGVPIWYVRKSLEKVIVQLAENISRQTEIMSKISEELRDQKHSLQTINDKVTVRR